MMRSTERHRHLVSISSIGENPLKTMRKVGRLDWPLEIGDLVRS